MGDEIRARLELARTLAASASDADQTQLCALLRSLNPERETVKRSLGGRVPLKRATAAELLEAVESESALALRLLPGGRCAYREAELAFHLAANSSSSGAIDCTGPAAPGLVCVRAGVRPVFTLSAHPGVYILPGALSLQQQEGLVRQSLRTFVERPNRRNIDAFTDPDASNLEWAARHGQSSSSLQPKRGAAAAVAQGAGFATGLWDAFVAAGAPPAASTASSPQPIDALTWSTLGLQYDWTARAYHLPSDPDYALHAHGEGRWSAPFPPSLHELCSSMVADLHAAVEQHLAAANSSNSAAAAAAAAAPDRAAWGLPLSLDAQAAIVNVYRGQAKLRLPMGGHSDNMERTMQRPVLSLSLGCPAIFLVGGHSKDSAPTPILLRSGDALVLSGASRAAYHGVPRVFEAELAAPPLFEGLGQPAATDPTAVAAAPDALPGSAEEEAAFHRFMAGCRVNVNVRQVCE